MLLTCALALILWLETAGSWPQLFLGSHQGVEMAFAWSLSWAGDGFLCGQIGLETTWKHVVCNMSPSLVHAFTAVSLLPSRSHIG